MGSLGTGCSLKVCWAKGYEGLHNRCYIVVPHSSGPSQAMLM